MANLSFSDEVQDWVRKVEGAEEAIFKESVQELVAEAQKPRSVGGHMRVDTGFLRASLLASTSAMPVINPAARPVEGKSYGYDGSEISAVIAGSELGQTIHLGYTASYAAFREFGSNGQAPDAFVRSAAQRWPQIVNAKTNELKSRLGL